MNTVVQRILFAPASGPAGSGEYFRCLCLAQAMKRRLPGLDVHFLLHREARLEHGPDLTYHELQATPSLAGNEATETIRRLRPALGVFDCSGRVRHLAEVRSTGGRTVWISNRPSQRQRGFRPRRLRVLDLHLIMDSGNPMPRLGPLEKLLLAVFPRTQVEFINLIAPEPASIESSARLARLADCDYAVFAAGGGGWSHDNQPVPEILVDAAVRFHRASGMQAVVVMGPQYRGAVRRHDEVEIIGQVTPAQLAGILSGARLAAVGARNMLSAQALTAATPCVMTAVGGSDQPHRVADYSRRGLVIGSRLEAGTLADSALQLLRQPDLARQLVEAAQSGGFRNDRELAVDCLVDLLAETGDQPLPPS